MSLDESVSIMSDLWHIVGSELRDAMYSPKYSNMNNLSMVDLSILQTIDRNKNIIFKEVCEILNMPKSTLTSAVNRLEKKELVRRIPSLHDKRQLCLELTKTGKKAQQDHLLSEYDVFSKVLSNMNSEERTLFLDLFSKAVNHNDMEEEK